jgi:hypothetical protein
MMAWENILFYFLFLGQILLISWYFPRKLLGRMKSVLETYPPSEYPKLYPKPLEYYKLGHWVFKLINRVILLLGFIILFAIIFVVDHAGFADDGYISEAWPAAFGMIQFLPLALLEFSEFSQFKLMRQANAATTRTAELRRRRLFDFISPSVLGLAVFLYLATIFFYLYAAEFVFEWGPLAQAMVVTVSNLALLTMGAWHLYGRKLNPHQTTGDRTRQIAVNLNSLLYVSMALSVFLMTLAAVDAFELDFLGAILMSLYFQIIVFLSIGQVLRGLKLEDIDFNVYKEQPVR